MSKTKSDLIAEALEELGATGTGQTASSQDITALDTRVTGLLDDLGKRNVYYFGDADDIPDETFNYLVKLLVETAPEKFGRPTDFQKVEFLEGRLRVLSRIGRGKGGPLKVDHALRPRRPLGTYGW